jgi:Tol biopolymer transport system component
VLSGSLLAYYALRNKHQLPHDYVTVDRAPAIKPDYSGCVIPPNSAPLNFQVQQDGTHYAVKIYSKHGEPMEVFSRSPKIIIPMNAWHKLLSENKGEELYFSIFVKSREGSWNRFSPVTNKIAREDIDGFIVYRKMQPTHHHTMSEMSVCQRNLENYDETILLDNGYNKSDSWYSGYIDCVNCHTFCNNRPKKTLLGVRGYLPGGATSPASTLFIDNNQVKKIGTKFGYTSWHPSGRLAIYSINNLPMFFHSARDEVRDTVNLDSLLAYFLADSMTIKTVAQISQKERLENWPAWSADGRYLYFCSAPKLWSKEDLKKHPPDGYRDVRYDLVRISYDIDTDTWGRVETILSAKDTGRSIAMPRVSPDGRWLSFCMIDYGYFPPWHSGSDLYLMDLKAAQETGQHKYRRLEINSDQSESWQCWSSNSRWIVFSSKRDYGVFTKPYFSYVDQQGKVYKPVLLPQKDPEFYESCVRTFNTPELIIEPVKATGEKLRRVVRNQKAIAVEIPVTMATPKEPGADGSEYPRE